MVYDLFRADDAGAWGPGASAPEHGASRQASTTAAPAGQAARDRSTREPAGALRCPSTSLLRPTPPVPPVIPPPTTAVLQNRQGPCLRNSSGRTSQNGQKPPFTAELFDLVR